MQCCFVVLPPLEHSLQWKLLRKCFIIKNIIFLWIYTICCMKTCCWGSTTITFSSSLPRWSLHFVQFSNQRKVPGWELFTIISLLWKVNQSNAKEQEANDEKTYMSWWNRAWLVIRYGVSRYQVVTQVMSAVSNTWGRYWAPTFSIILKTIDWDGSMIDMLAVYPVLLDQSVLVLLQLTLPDSWLGWWELSNGTNTLKKNHCIYNRAFFLLLLQNCLQTYCYLC